MKTLCDAPEKIQKMDVFLSSSDSVVKGRRKALSEENKKPLFDAHKVHKVGDIPAGWLWGWFSKVCESPPSPEQISLVSATSINMRCIRQLATVIPDSLPLTPELRDKVNCSAFFAHRHKERKHILTNGQGFFRTAIGTKGQVNFEGHHGVFYFVADPDDATLVKLVVHTPSGGQADISQHTELVLQMGMKINKNYDDFGAHVLVARQKLMLCTLFTTLVKPKIADVAMDVDVYLAELSRTKDENTIVMDEAISQAAKRHRKAPEGAPRASLTH